ncbi:hypothetical protein [Polyangium sp. 6x1]|uniref:hypothetical protein n=1 Tax=Polyangium sp. 6x1 TaxID=3042689 RepID=UPI00248327D9|nr:hypothetical protein [Polyangium sp. 6x1]MDI1451893.1 hypothetical protein [Polyangium sp. 6x1]
MRPDEDEQKVQVQHHLLDALKHRTTALREVLQDVRETRAEVGSGLDDAEATLAGLKAMVPEEALEQVAREVDPAEEVLPELTDDELRAIEVKLPRFDPLEAIPMASVEQWNAAVDAYRSRYGLDLVPAPLEGLLPPERERALLDELDRRFGRVSWSRWDYAGVALAAALAIAVDFVLVAIPKDMKFLGRDYLGSPVTKHLSSLAARIDAGGDANPFLRWLGQIAKSAEDWAKVPYDIARNNPADGVVVDGLRPKMHRLMSPGHDPLLGVIFGVVDQLRGHCTLIDRAGTIRVLERASPGSSVILAIAKVLAHLLSDVWTPAGLPPPMFAVLQLFTAKSPFVLTKGGARVTIGDAARWMYGNGFTLGHFATSSIVPLVAEAIVQAWVVLSHLHERKEAGELAPALRRKRAEMVLAVHGMVCAGNVAKIACLRMNPLALNWSEWGALAVRAFGAMRAVYTAEVEREQWLEERWRALLHVERPT